MEEEIKNKTKEFREKFEPKVAKAWRKHKKFLELFPFRKDPENIELLTSEKIYNPPGDKTTFLYWIEFGLKDLGHLRVGSALYAENARDNLVTFKALLHQVVNDSVPIAGKIDAHWEDIKGFGGDRTIAKKIVFCYYPQKSLPIFKTEHLEHFAHEMKLDFKKEAIDLFGKAYDILTTGQKFEVLNSLLLKYRNSNSEIKNWDNLLFSRFLYEYFTPEKIAIAGRETKPMHPLGILFEPEYEQEVVYLFAVFHRELGFPYIIRLRYEFPDALVMDKKRNPQRIEFEVKSSDFIQHKHDRKGCDFIVCWENDLENTEGLPPIIALKDFVEELS